MNRSGYGAVGAARAQALHAEADELIRAMTALTQRLAQPDPEEDAS